MKKSTVLLIAVSLLALVLLNYSSFGEEFSDLLGGTIVNWGYYGIFLGVLVLEFVPQPLISALLPVSAGIFFHLDFVYVLVLAISGSVLSNYFAYFLGKKYGAKLVSFFVSKDSYQNAQRWFDMYGNKSILVLALTPLPYFPILGGTFGMNFKEFSLYAVIPRICHFVIFSSLILWLM